MNRMTILFPTEHFQWGSRFINVPGLFSLTHAIDGTRKMMSTTVSPLNDLVSPYRVLDIGASSATTNSATIMRSGKYIYMDLDKHTVQTDINSSQNKQPCNRNILSLKAVPFLSSLPPVSISLDHNSLLSAFLCCPGSWALSDSIHY